MSKFNPNNYLMKLKGKDYLEVKWRMVWLREDHPNATIETDHIIIEEDRAVFKAVVSIPEAGKATGYGSETKKDFGDFIEKAETKAVGRALAGLGYGTQFAPELDEGERVVDSPVQPPKAPQNASQAPAKAMPANGKPATEAAFKRIYAILGENGLDQTHLKAWATHNEHEHTRELTTDELKRLAEGLKSKTEVTVAYLTKLAGELELKQAGAELGAKIDGAK